MSFKIAYCAGHGINTPGKRSPAGEREWTFNNKVALAFEEEMKKYEDVELLRLDDRTGKTDVPLKTRTDKANAWGADIYISFHHNAWRGVWDNHTGTEVFHYATSIEGKRLAEIVLKEVIKAYRLRNRGLKTDNLHITRETNMPAILIEGGFMDSRIDIIKLRDDNVLKNAGISVAKAVAEYADLKVAKDKNELDTIKINLHGKKTEIKGIFKDDVNYIPIRFLEKLGYEIGWENGVVTIEYRNKEE
ncbi:MAG TPA: N-acetylmuramoyl-L-alanine amidase [Thermoanaerobacterales bacterium]|nr:N-acetylmuramoyl-L-alanine amidase [Thermoanaerobacterales bacterium]